MFQTRVCPLLEKLNSSYNCVDVLLLYIYKEKNLISIINLSVFLLNIHLMFGTDVTYLKSPFNLQSKKTTHTQTRTLVWLITFGMKFMLLKSIWQIHGVYSSLEWEKEARTIKMFSYAVVVQSHPIVRRIYVFVVMCK